jgi:hypothetical protein
MIRYALKCDRHHEFESWFHSADTFDKLKAGGMVSCLQCGSDQIEKLLMTPAVRPSRRTKTAEPAPRPLAEPASPAEAALAAIRRQIEENSEYVGLNFAAEARAIHDGDSPIRSIYGEARAEEAKALIRDGVPVAPLPFLPTRKAN